MKILFFFAACFLLLVLGDYGCNPKSEQDFFSSNCSSIIFKGVRSFNLTKLIKIQHREVFIMIGDTFFTSIHCIGNAGMFISHIKNVKLNNVQFHECGFHHYLYDTYFSNAVLILNSTNITIRSVCFCNTNGVGLVLLNSSGHINIYNSSFEQGEVLEITGNYTVGGGGGGIHIQQNGTDELTDVTITIQNTDFTNNAARTHCKPTACNSFCSFGYGGGLTIALRNYSHSANIIINNCHFINNSAFAGGGVEIILCNSPDTNLDLKTVEFSGNTASKEGGGGIDILWSKSISSKTRINFNKVNFFDNYGKYGGAVAIAIASPDVASGHINFKDCHWASNTALYGSALDILHKQRAGKLNNHILQIENCSFTKNSNCYQMRDEKLIQQGAGMISVTGLTLVYTGIIKFSGNDGPVMYVVETAIKFDEAIVHFESNVAEYGSCIALTGRSVIIVNNNSAIHFYNNWAQFGSSTIYHLDLDENQNIESSRYAFRFVVSDGANSSFFYCGNTLPQNGQYLDGKMKYDTSLAKILSEVSELNATVSDKCDPNMSFKPTPASLHVCRDTKQHLDNINFIPGIEKTIAQFNSSLLLRVSLFRSGSVSVEVPKIYEYITNELMLYGKPGSSVTVYLHDESIQGLHYIFTGILVACPPFYLLTEDNKCKCYDDKVTRYKYFYKCTTTAQNSSFSSILPGYWIGLGNSLNQHNNASILVGICPTGYCRARDLSSDYLIIPYNDGRIEQGDLDKVLCNNRQGVLCGSCSNGMVVYFHSHNYICGPTDKCHRGILFLLLSEIFPVTAIFLALIFFNVKLTAGGISGFIFFAQMYESVSIKLENNIYGLPFKYTVFHHIFYQLFNFEFIEIDSLSFCLMKGLKTLDILAVKYAMSAYALLLILVTIFITKYCGRFKFASNKCRKYSIVQVFSTFIVIVYSKCTLISISLLWYQDLYQGHMSVHKVVSLQGVVTLFDKHHVPYAIAAIAVLIFFIIPLPVLLIFYPLANKWILRLKIDNFFLVKIVSRLFPLFKLLPLFDSFQGIFKEKYRFFSGLYFVYRISILTSLFALDVSAIYMICTLQFIVILLIHTLSWPYKQRIHNVIDALLLANLAIISGLKLAMISLIKYNSKIIQLVQGLEIIFVNVPILVLLIYVLIKFFHLFVKFFRKAPDNISDLFLTDDIRTSDHCYMKLSRV